MTQLVSSVSRDVLDEWIFSPLFPCTQESMRIADIVVRCLTEIRPANYYDKYYQRLHFPLAECFFQPSEVDYRTQKKVERIIWEYLDEDPIFYTREDVIVFSQVLGWGAQKLVCEGVGLFGNKTFAAQFKIDPGGSLKPEYECALMWNGRVGLLGTMGYYRDDEGREVILVPKYDMDLASYLKEQVSISLASCRVIILHVMQGLSTMQADGYYHPDMRTHNILITRDQKGEVIEVVVCDYAFLSKSLSTRNSCAIRIKQIFNSLLEKAKATSCSFGPQDVTFEAISEKAEAYFRSHAQK